MHDARHDPDDEDMTYDLRTLPERERADVAALRRTCDKLADALAYLTKRVDDLERAIGADLGRTSHDVAALRAWYRPFRGKHHDVAA